LKNKRLRLLRMGLETVLGRRRQGFFAPYRYAATVPPPGPYPELEEVFRRACDPSGDGGASLNETLLDIERSVGRIAAVGAPPPEPRWNQGWFPRLDAAAAYSLVLGSGGTRVIEVGSGHSTRFIARAARDRASVAISPRGEEGARPEPLSITCIDPEPRASLDGLAIDWRREVLGTNHLDLFRELRAGDIAFFDSSHLLWPGTDVDLILNRILPSLAPGVLVHVHDVFLPDAYPADWEWRGYTEQLGLGGYLTSPKWRIVWASHYAVTRLGAARRPALAALPLVDGARESSLWLERRAQGGSGAALS
jgi:hypothetical protein